MSSLKSMKNNDGKKFVPKRRAPYLLQKEIIDTGVSTSYRTLKKDKDEKDITISKIENNQGLIVTNQSDDSLILSDAEAFYEEVSKLYGIQKKLVHYFVRCCITRKSLSTGAVTAETLCLVTNTTKKTLKKILQRLIEKKFIARTEGRRGRGGFSVFCLHKDLIDIVRLQLSLQNDCVSSIQALPESPMSKYNPSNSLPDDWVSIDFSSLEEIKFGFSQIKQIYHKKTNTSEVVQNSINHLAFTLKYKKEQTSKYNDILAVFMSVLLKGGDWVEKDYISPNEIAQKNLLSQKKIKQQRQEDFEKNAYELALQDWKNELSENEQEKIAPAASRTPPQSVRLSMYFRENVWREVKAEFLLP